MKRRAKILNRVLFILLLSAFFITMGFPVFFMFTNSLMPEIDISSVPPRLLPSRLVLDNYIEAFTMQPLLLYLFNSAVVTIIVLVICTVCGALASYALTRTNIRFKKLFLIFILAIALLPPITIINPLFRIFSTVGLLNSYIGLALVCAVCDLPMVIWFMTALFKSIPVSIEESAELEGCNMFHMFVDILLPMIKTGIFSINILVFISAWNQYLFSQVFNQHTSHRTVVVGMTLYQTTLVLPFGTISAAAAVIVIPLILMVLVFQKNILGGIMHGGVKE